MHIEQYKSNSRAYLRLVSGKRMKDSLGRPIIGKRIVLSLGALAKHDDGRPDYLKRLRESFAEGRPLIKELEPYVDQAPVRKWTVTYERGDAMFAWMMRGSFAAPLLCSCAGELKFALARIGPYLI